MIVAPNELIHIVQNRKNQEALGVARPSLSEPVGRLFRAPLIMTPKIGLTGPRSRRPGGYRRTRPRPTSLTVLIATRLVLGCTNIAALPEGLRVGGGLYLQHTNITALPKGLNNVSGDLALSDTNITALRVGGFLDVEDTSTAALPEGLSVGGPPLFDRHKNYGAARGAQCWWDPLS